MKEEEAQQDVVEAVKRHILSMLHLQDRPNITHPVPRAALLNAIRKVHVGRVAKDGSVLIDEEPHGRLEADNSEQTEIITFAEAGESLSVFVYLCVCLNVFEKDSPLRMSELVCKDKKSWMRGLDF